MAYRTEQNGEDLDIVIDGWQTGISDSPYANITQSAYGNFVRSGIADIRNMNILSVPGDASVSFANLAVTLPPVLTATSFTATASSDTITISSTAGFYNGMAIIINTISGGTGLSATAGSNTYFVGTITATTFKLYTDVGFTQLVTITGNGSGTLSTAQLGSPVDSCTVPSTTFDAATGGNYNYVFVLDSNGQVWFLGNGPDGAGLNVLQFMGNTNHTNLTNSLSFGISGFKGYLFVFLDNKIDYIKLTDIFGSTGPSGNWHIGWKTITTSSAGHQAIAATDDALYFCNATAVGSILQNAGTTFDPATSTTYTFNTAALQLPTYDNARSLAQLGVSLLVGGIQNYVYPWDRVSTSFNYPLVIAEKYIKNIVSTNAVAYIFAGTRGRIYQTNGSNVDLFQKFPDQVAGVQNPYYTWGGAIYMRNQLYFGISAKTNAGVAINNFAGVWGIDLDAEALYLATSLSYATYTGTVPVIVPVGSITPTGLSFYTGWVNGTGGIDYSSSSPYTNFEAYIDTDIIPVGTYYAPETDQQIEYKLAKPLVSGESVRIAWRGNLTDSFTTIFTDSTVGAISGAGQVNFQKQQWVQLRISTSSTASSPSYTRVREIRIR